MWNKINNNGFSMSLIVSVVAVSILSILLIEKHVLAQWVNPGTVPGSSGQVNVVFNPLAENLDLSGKLFFDSAIGTKRGVVDATITTVGKAAVYGEGYYGLYGKTASGGVNAGYFEGDVHVTGNLTVDGSSPGGGGGSLQQAYNDGGSALGREIITAFGKPIKITGLPNDNNVLQLESTASPLRLTSAFQNVIDYYRTGTNINPYTFIDFSGVGFRWWDAAGATPDERGTILVMTPITATGGGNVGIGRRFSPADPPNSLLHLRSTSTYPNAEIDIQSGKNSHWAIYNDETSNDLIFWNTNTDNLLTLETDGDVGIGTVDPNARLDVRNTGTEDILNLFDGSTEVLTVTDGGKVGIGAASPLSKLQIGDASFIGLGGITYGSPAQLTYATTDRGLAGYYQGDLIVTHSGFGSNSYIQVPYVSSGVPPATDCDAASETARIIYDSSTDTLYVCTGAAWSAH